MKEYIKNCKQCSREFRTTNIRKEYCCSECKAIYHKPNKTVKKYTYVCDYCKTEIHNRHKKKDENTFCNANCRRSYYREVVKIISNCKVCGKEFIQEHKNHLYCCQDCKYKNQIKVTKSKTYICTNCNKEYNTKSRKKGDHSFCSKECCREFLSNQGSIFKNCEFCGEEFKTRKSVNTRFCSMKCQGKWQSEYRVGENSSTYNHNIPLEERVVVCEVCNKEFYKSPKEAKLSRYCSRKCKLLGKEHNSKPQQIINNSLDKKSVLYNNEHEVGYYHFDNYLMDFNLLLEIMGNYWHCNPTMYDIILNKTQKDGIRKDKSKHSYTLKYHNIEILYLWEYDITHNLELCEKLIDLYIFNKGELQNYHSFNYDLDINGNIILKKDIVKSYFEYDSKEILKFYKNENPPATTE